MADIFREVEEDLRHDKLEEVWRKYGKWLIGIIAASLIGAVVVVLVQGWLADKREAESDAYFETVALIDAGDLDAATTALAEISDNSSAGYRTLSRYHHAALLRAQDDDTGALAIYESIAADSGINQAFRELAQLRAAWLLADTASGADLQFRVARLLDDENSWRHSARELLAYVAFREEKYADARDAYIEIFSDIMAPNGIRTRAIEMLRVIEDKMPAPVIETTEPTEDATPVAEVEETAPVADDNQE